MEGGRDQPGDLTILLQKWRHGDTGALDRLVPEVYPELHAMARRFLSREQKGTIQATTLVHDLYLRLLRQERANFPNRRAFFGFAAGAMRHILIDHIRARHSEKRGARRARVPLSDDLQFVDPSNEDILDLDRAIDELAAFDARKAELVQLCAFLGCGRSEAAELLGISLATAKRDFRVARAWLSQRLQRQDDAGADDDAADRP
jgi:RNA polymerase sigma factor (TIGR02999 family)